RQSRYFFSSAIGPRALRQAAKARGGVIGLECRRVRKVLQRVLRLSILGRSMPRLAWSGALTGAPGTVFRKAAMAPARRQLLPPPHYRRYSKARPSTNLVTVPPRSPHRGPAAGSAAAASTSCPCRHPRPLGP